MCFTLNIVTINNLVEHLPFWNVWMYCCFLPIVSMHLPKALVDHCEQLFDSDAMIVVPFLLGSSVSNSISIVNPWLLINDTFALIILTRGLSKNAVPHL